MPLVSSILNKAFSLNGSCCSNALSSVALPRHRWYFVKEAFSPELVTMAIQQTNLQPGELIVDPFCGSGTVPLVAASKNYKSIGLEVNPFLAFLSRTKLRQCSAHEISEHIDQVREAITVGEVSKLEMFSTFCQHDHLAKWLFNTEVLRGFEGGWRAVEAYSKDTRELMQLALLSAAMDTCNATRDGKALRYRSTWKSSAYSISDFLTAFDRRINAIMTDLESCPIQPSPNGIIQADSRSELAHLADRFGLCVTSPPYLNSFDYTDIYRPELFLGHFVSSREELRAIRHTTVRSHVQAKWKDPTRTDFGQQYSECITLIDQRRSMLWNSRIPLMIQAYFEDLRIVLSDLRKLAKPGSALWLVVSTSAYAGVEVPVDLILAEIGEAVGWIPVEVGVLRYLRTSSQHWDKWRSQNEAQWPKLRESVVIFHS